VTRESLCSGYGAGGAGGAEGSEGAEDGDWSVVSGASVVDGIDGVVVSVLKWVVLVGVAVKRPLGP
jgi:hypothetical protein